MAQEINFEEITLRSEINSRGGGIEIDLTSLGFNGGKMAAYQNYLGGGLLGRVMVNDNLRQKDKPFLSEEDNQKLDEIADQLKRYLFNMTNPDGEWESRTYEQNQLMPISAY